MREELAVIDALCALRPPGYSHPPTRPLRPSAAMNKHTLFFCAHRLIAVFENGQGQEGLLKLYTNTQLSVRLVCLLSALTNSVHPRSANLIVPVGT
jgi:hypothetical protein